MSCGNNLQFVEAVLFSCRAGIPWRDISGRFGDFCLVPARFSRRTRRNVWKKLFPHWAAEADSKYTMWKKVS
jgi:transposase